MQIELYLSSIMIDMISKTSYLYFTIAEYGENLLPLRKSQKPIRLHTFSYAIVQRFNKQ